LRRLRCFLVGAAVASVAAFPAARAAPPGPPPTAAATDAAVSLSEADRGDFEAAFASVARQAHVAFICEGAPLRTAPTADGALRDRLAARRLPLDAAVRDLADAFDYEAAQGAPDVFVLTKRYSEADDLPPITLDEAALALRGILKAGAPFNPREDVGHVLTRLLRAAGSERREALASGAVIGALPPDLRTLGQQVAYSIHFDYSLSAVDAVVRRLDACRRQRAYFVRRPFDGGAAVPALEGPFAPNGATLYVSLTFPVWIAAPGQTILTAARRDGVDHGVAGTPDPTAPEASRPEERRSPLACERTLAQLAAAVTGPLAADPAVAAKRVCVFGAENTAPEALLNAAARLYGLRLAHGSEGGKLTLPSPRPVRVPADVVEEACRLLPSFLRAVTAGVRRSSGADSIDEAAGDTLYIAAVRRLRGRIEPALERSGGQSLPVAEAGPAASELLAVASLASTFSRLRRLLLPPPGFVTDPDHARLTVTLNGGTATYTLMGADGSGITGTAEVAAP
jgi:hypothetical protein